MKKILKYYKETLKIDLSDLTHPISVKINSIPYSSKIDQKVKKHHLRIFGLSLMDIKDYDDNIYDFYLKRIVNNSDISIHGHIFEINQCAHFIRTSSENKLEFKFGDANQNEPDFIVENIGFEITSIRFLESSDKSNPGRKLLNKFINKNKKEYANENTVLIIDINQPSYHTIKKEKRVAPTLDEVREIIKKESKFGLVLYFMEWIDNDNDNDNLLFKGTTYSDYSENCTTELKSLMEKHIYKGDILISPN
ncbi:hypothetical protein [Polaribacter sp. SA4-12]|uniref:hypothetical protein n=1 Tax=Polaribacter sp. SA4-12 TaxID=1312072 RepID=UPI000B3C7653|nr:hypothetical protein [Polaribacter sp. SA4-12]ARV15420.1 hypothetical protein BTO07_09840 [Polaribacter sp. SA4-12]